MRSPLLTKFLNKIKAHAQPDKPKFEVGDYIMNNWKGLKLVSEVVDVMLYGKQEMYEVVPVGQPTKPPRYATPEESWGSEIGEYTLLDVINEHSPTQAKNNAEGVKRIYKRHRSIRKIDSTYVKVDPKVARILYGKKE